METITIKISGFGTELERTIDADLAANYLLSQGLSLEDPQAALSAVFIDTVTPILKRGLQHKQTLEAEALEQSLKGG